MSKKSTNIEFIDTHAHCHLLRRYHKTDGLGNEVIDDEYCRFLEDFQMQTGPYTVSKVINIPITLPQNIDWSNNDTRSIFFSKKPECPGIFREKLKDDEGNSIKGLTYFAQGIHPKFVHQFLYKDFLYVNGESTRKKPSTAQDLVSEKELARRENIVKELLEERIKNNSDVVAIGETGFELYYDFEKRVCDHPAYQEKWFRYHLDLAYEYDLPLIIHLRSGERKEQNANKRALKILQEYKAQGKLRPLPGVIHCFIGNKSEAAEFHRLGFVLGIGAAFTYGDPYDPRNRTKEMTDFQLKHYHRLYRVVCDAPLSWFVLETDSPYLPLKDDATGYKENTPLSIPMIADHIVKARNEAKRIKCLSSGIPTGSVLTIEKVAKVTTSNALRVFPEIEEERRSSGPC
ncbi:MAG: TatD family hydrolase [Lachnospiraceae bacterium]|nr:TatD family hydrolase [Lachnospiraceae bacterium]